MQALREPKDHRAGMGAPKQAMDPRHCNFKKSEYVCVLIQGKAITPMFEEVVTGTQMDSLSECHSDAYFNVKSRLKDFCNAHSIDFSKLILVERSYDLGDMAEVVVKEVRFISLENNYMFMIRHQFTHASYEEDQDALAKTVVALQAGFTSYRINCKVWAIRDVLISEKVSDDVKVSLVLQGHLEPDIAWMDVHKDTLGDQVILALEHIWKL